MLQKVNKLKKGKRNNLILKVIILRTLNILHLSNIATVILDFSLLLPIKLSHLLALKGDSEKER
jgi:hypothetical protein